MKIEGVDLNEEHRGRAVTYFPYHGAAREVGVISNWNRNFVFVKFRGDIYSKACRPEDLRWRE